MARNRPTKPESIPENLDKLLIALLGNRVDGNEYAVLIETLGMPTGKDAVGSRRFFYYDAYGVTISYDTSTNRFYQVGFHFDTTSVRSGDILRYEGSLPAGIKTSDSCWEVEVKLGTPPELSNWVRGCESNACDPESALPSYWQKYFVAPLEYTVMFYSEEGVISMLGLGIR